MQNNHIEELLTRILVLLADTLKDQLVLKGGLHLRLLNSPRATQDIDGIIRSPESKKIIAEQLRTIIANTTDLILDTMQVNSRGIVCHIRNPALQVSTVLELAVLPKTMLPPSVITSAPLTQQYHMMARAISALALPEAFAHKIAAALERDVVRDLYDLTILEPLGPFDRTVLTARLNVLSINRKKPSTTTMAEAAQLLREKNAALTESRVTNDLSPMLPQNHLPGLIHVIRNTTNRVIQSMEYGE